MPIREGRRFRKGGICLDQQTENTYKNLENQIKKIYSHARQGSFKTRERYYAANQRFCKFLAEKYNTKKFANISNKHVEAYVKHLQEQGKSASTIKTDLSAIRYFHDQCANAKHKLAGNDSFDLEKRRFGGVDRTWSKEQYKGMVDKARSLGQDRVANAMILARQGLRIHEVFRLDRATAENALKTGQLHVKGKGGLERDVPLRNEAREVLERRIAEVERGQKLFIEQGEKTHLVIKQTQNWIVRHREEFSDKKITFHGLRHSYAHEEYQRRIDSGMSALKARLEVSELLGHHRDDVTNIYLAK